MESTVELRLHDIRAREWLDPQGRIVPSGARLAEAVCGWLQRGYTVRVLMDGVRGFPSSYFNAVLQRVTEVCGPEALDTRVVFDRFESPTQLGVYQRSREAFAPTPQPATQREHALLAAAPGAQPPSPEASSLQGDKEFWRQSSERAESILKMLRRTPKTGAASTAVELLLNRVIEDMNSLWVLRLHSAHTYSFAGAVILRAIYDTHLQALYILREPDQREARGQLYLDFEWVEKRSLTELIDRNPTAFAGQLRTSPRREMAGPLLGREYERVQSQYRRREGKGCRSTWYAGSLRDLAKAVDVEGEYEIVQRLLSGAVHSSPFTLRYGSVMRETHLLTMAWHLAFRILGGLADLHALELPQELRGIVQESRPSFLG